MLSSWERLYLVINTVQSGSRREGRANHQDVFSSFTQPLVMICLLYRVVFSPDCSELCFIPWHFPEQNIYSTTWEGTREHRSGHLPCYYVKWLYNPGDPFENLIFLWTFPQGIFFNSEFKTMVRLLVTSRSIKDQKAAWDPPPVPGAAENGFIF